MIKDLILTLHRIQILVNKFFISIPHVYDKYITTKNYLVLCNIYDYVIIFVTNINCFKEIEKRKALY